MSQFPPVTQGHTLPPPLSPDLCTLSSLLPLFERVRSALPPTSSKESTKNSLEKLIDHFEELVKIENALSTCAEEGKVYSAVEPSDELGETLRQCLSEFYWHPDFQQNALSRPALRAANIIAALASKIVSMCRKEVEAGGIESVAGGSAVELGASVEWRAGKREWKEGKEDIGRGWEHVRTQMWEGLGEDLVANKTEIKNAPVRTVVQEELLQTLVDEFVSHAVSAHERSAVSEVLCSVISKHAENKGILRKILTASMLGKVLKSLHDRGVSHCALELAFRLSPSANQQAEDQVAWVKELFPTSAFGTDADAFRRQFSDISSNSFESRANEILAAMASGHLERAQPFSTRKVEAYPTSNPTRRKVFLPTEEPMTSAGASGLLGWYINRWSISATVMVAMGDKGSIHEEEEYEEEQYPSRFEIPFNTVDGVYFVVDEEKNELTVQVKSEGAPLVAGDSIEEVKFESQYPKSTHNGEEWVTELFLDLGDQQSELKKIFDERAKLYPQLVVLKGDALSATVEKKKMPRIVQSEPLKLRERFLGSEGQEVGSSGSQPRRDDGDDRDDDDDGRPQPRQSGSLSQPQPSFADKRQTILDILNDPVTDGSEDVTTKSDERRALDAVDEDEEPDTDEEDDAQSAAAKSALSRNDNTNSDVVNTDAAQDEEHSDEEDGQPAPKTAKAKAASVTRAGKQPTKQQPAQPSPDPPARRTTRSTSKAPGSKPSSAAAPVVVKKPTSAPKATANAKAPPKKPTPPAKRVTIEDNNDDDEESQPVSTLPEAKEPYKGKTYGKKTPAQPKPSTAAKAAPKTPTAKQLKPLPPTTLSTGDRGQSDEDAVSVKVDARSKAAQKQTPAKPTAKQTKTTPAPVKVAPTKTATARSTRANSVAPAAKTVKQPAAKKVEVKPDPVRSGRPERAAVAKTRAKAAASKTADSDSDEDDSQKGAPPSSGSETDYDEQSVSRKIEAKRKRARSSSTPVVPPRPAKKAKVVVPPASKKVVAAKPIAPKKDPSKPKRLTDSEKAKLKKAEEEERKKRKEEEGEVGVEEDERESLSSEFEEVAAKAKEAAPGPKSKKRKSDESEEEISDPPPGKRRFTDGAAAKAVLDRDKARKKPTEAELDAEPKSTKKKTVKELLEADEAQPAPAADTDDGPSALASVAQDEQQDDDGDQADGYEPPMMIEGDAQAEDVAAVAEAAEVGHAQGEVLAANSSVSEIEDDTATTKQHSAEKQAAPQPSQTRSTRERTESIEDDSPTVTQKTPRDAGEPNVLVAATPSDQHTSSQPAPAREQPPPTAVAAKEVITPAPAVRFEEKKKEVAVDRAQTPTQLAPAMQTGTARQLSDVQEETSAAALTMPDSAQKSKHARLQSDDIAHEEETEQKKASAQKQTERQPAEAQPESKEPVVDEEDEEAATTEVADEDDERAARTQTRAQPTRPTRTTHNRRGIDFKSPLPGTSTRKAAPVKVAPPTRDSVDDSVTKAQPPTTASRHQPSTRAGDSAKAAQSLIPPRAAGAPRKSGATDIPGWRDQVESASQEEERQRQAAAEKAAAEAATARPAPTQQPRTSTRSARFPPSTPHPNKQQQPKAKATPLAKAPEKKEFFKPRSTQQRKNLFTRPVTKTQRPPEHSRRVSFDRDNDSLLGGDEHDEDVEQPAAEVGGLGGGDEFDLLAVTRKLPLRRRVSEEDRRETASTFMAIYQFHLEQAVLEEQNAKKRVMAKLDKVRERIVKPGIEDARKHTKKIARIVGELDQRSQRLKTFAAKFMDELDQEVEDATADRETCMGYGQRYSDEEMELDG